MNSRARNARCIGSMLAAASLLLSATLAASEPSWEQVYLNGPIQHRLADGSVRTLKPSCSGGPELRNGVPRPANTQFSFFIQRGNASKLLIALDGGGACWNEATCIGSALAGQPTYTRTVDETPAQLAAGDGLLDTSRPDNPYKEYTKVFVPYCTGDVHFGTRDTTYVLSLPGADLPWTIHHRGSDNLLSVLDWLQKNARRTRVELKRTQDLSVIGLSAGAYGTLLAFAHFAEATPKARHNLIADAGIGVLTRKFYERALFDADAPGSESWGFGQALPSWVPGFQTMLQTASAQPTLLMPLAFQALGEWKPRARFASITADLDLTQVYFYTLMKGNLVPGPVEAAEWYAGMKGITAATASLPNYRYFIESGTFHTFLADDARSYDAGAAGIPVAEWIRQMTKPGNRVWDNVEAPPSF